MEHIVYLKGKTKGNEPGLHRVHREFVEILRQAAQFDVAGSELDSLVASSMKDDAVARSSRLKLAPTEPEQQLVLSRVFKRNPDVIAEVVLRAGRNCENCGRVAPFVRPDGRPYLEVHHLIRLADGGDDTVSNAIAVCPNCHRERHFGAKSGRAGETMLEKAGQV